MTDKDKAFVNNPTPTIQEEVLTLRIENEVLTKENAEMREKLYTDSKNVFAELNEETANSNAELLDIVEDLKEQIEKMKKEISVLLSCSNCPENKGGYVCEKEYNDKCLAQKIQYIKELKEENEKMKSFIHSEIDFCMYCPLTKDCKNDEGTCPYACATEEEQKNFLLDFIQKWELAE